MIYICEIRSKFCITWEHSGGVRLAIAMTVNDRFGAGFDLRAHFPLSILICLVITQDLLVTKHAFSSKRSYFRRRSLQF